jgi:hypothetical protein
MVLSMSGESLAIPTSCAFRGHGRRGRAGPASFRSGLCQPCQPVPETGRGAGLLAGRGPAARCRSNKAPERKWGPVLLPTPPKGQNKWGPAFLPAPTVAAAGTLAFQRLSSPRPSAVPCPSDCVLSNGLPPVRFAVRSRLQAGVSLSAQPSVLRRPQFLTAWAWQSLVPVPHSARCRASCRCERVSLRSSSGAAPVSPAFRPHLRTVPPVGRQGPFRAVWRAAPRSASAGLCPRSCDLRPFRISLASGRHSGLRSQSFRFAFRRFQSAPQHAESGFIAYFSVRPDWKISAFQSAPCSAFLRLCFPLDKTDAAPRD